MPSSPELVRDAIGRYLTLLEQDAGTTEDDLRELADILDELAALGRHAPDVFDDQPDPPSVDYKPFRDLASKRFSTLGLYNLPADIASAVGEAELVVADAIDDLADIARDFAGVRWCFEHTSENDALWHFRFGYESHWGKHLSDLRWYLHALRFEY